MARCTRKENLEVHHKRRDGGNGLENAEVLCKTCHQNTSTHSVPGTSPPPFSDSTKSRAFRRAKFQCECMRISGCH